MSTAYWHRVRSLLQRFNSIIARSCGAPPFRLDQSLADNAGGEPATNFYDVFLPTYALQKHRPTWPPFRVTAAEKPKVLLKVTLAMLPLNAIGNCVFMTGIGLITSFGPIGTGILSLIVAMASFAIPVIVIRFVAPCSVS